MKPTTGKYAKIIYQGEPWEKHYQDKFRARRSVMLHAVNRGWTLKDCEEALTAHELWATGSDGRQLSLRETHKRLSADHAAASTYQRNNPGYHSAADARAYIGELRELADQWPWQGKAGRTDRDTLRFIHRAGTWVGCDRINVASRDVSIGTGISQHTARVAIRRLAAAGWLEQVKESKPGLAPFYRLTNPSNRCPRTSHMTSPTAENHMSGFGTPTEPDHEVWVRLGKTAMDLHSVLGHDPVSARKAGRRVDVAKSTVCRLLPVLAAHGLAVKTGDGWIRGTDDLDRVAESQGWTGLNSKRVQRGLQYERERGSQRFHHGLPKTQSVLTVVERLKTPRDERLWTARRGRLCRS